MNLTKYIITSGPLEGQECTPTQETTQPGHAVVILKRIIPELGIHERAIIPLNMLRPIEKTKHEKPRNFAEVIRPYVESLKLAEQKPTPEERKAKELREGIIARSLHELDARINATPKGDQ